MNIQESTHQAFYKTQASTFNQIARIDSVNSQSYNL